MDYNKETIPYSELKEEAQLKESLLQTKVEIINCSCSKIKIDKELQELFGVNEEKIENKIYTINSICSQIKKIIVLLVGYFQLSIILNASTFIEIIISFIVSILSLVISFVGISEICQIIIQRKITKLKNSTKYIEIEKTIRDRQKQKESLEKKEKELLRKKDNITANLQNTRKNIFQQELEKKEDNGLTIHDLPKEKVTKPYTKTKIKKQI